MEKNTIVSTIASALLEIHALAWVPIVAFVPISAGPLFEEVAKFGVRFA